MKLPRFLRRFVRSRQNRLEHREATLAKIKALGFQVEDLSGWHDGKFAARRYRLTSPTGEVLDNHGEGYASSQEAYRAARANLGKHS